MVEYNETLTFYQTFIDFSFKFFVSIQGTSGTILKVLGAVWDRNFNEKLWFKGVLQKNDPKKSKIIFNHTFMDDFFWLNQILASKK